MSEFDASRMPPQEAYGILTRIVAPRPIAFVSTIDASGRPNLAPFSYFNMGGANPPSVVFSVTNNRHGKEKDTLLNIRETREYVINAVSHAMAERMNVTSAALPRGESEWIPSGLHQEPSARVRPARVAESPIAMECILHAIVPHGDGPIASHYIIGEVVQIRVADAVMTDGVIDPLKCDFIGRMGGAFYCTTGPGTLFSMDRPADPPAPPAPPA